MEDIGVLTVPIIHILALVVDAFHYNGYCKVGL